MQPGADLPPAEMAARTRRLVIAALCALGAALLLALLYLWWPGQRTVASDVVEVSLDAPVRVDEDAVLERLNSATTGDWQASRYTGRRLAALAEDDALALDVKSAARSRTVLTNLEDDGSVGRNGRLVLVGPSFRPAVARLVEDDPTVFADPEVEEERRTYRLGGWIAYYSPHGADTDRSDTVEAYLADVVACPYDADACAGGDS